MNEKKEERNLRNIESFAQNEKFFRDKINGCEVSHHDIPVKCARACLHVCVCVCVYLLCACIVFVDIQFSNSQYRTALSAMHSTLRPCHS